MSGPIVFVVARNGGKAQVEIETDVEPEAKKRSFTVQTIKKWVLENEKILGTSM